MSDTVLGYYENIFLAALDHGDYELADKNLKVLVKQFPNSNRVKRLIGMSMECEGIIGFADHVNFQYLIAHIVIRKLCGCLDPI
jgi:hypothetical protein